jgi:hypothetical protein
MLRLHLKTLCCFRYNQFINKGNAFLNVNLPLTPLAYICDLQYCKLQEHSIDPELGEFYLCLVYQEVLGFLLNDNLLLNSEIHLLQKSAWTFVHKSPSK